jgi:hypothetical protein
MKKDYRLMSDLAEHTRPAPSARVQEVVGIVARIASDPDCKTELDNWGLSLVPHVT